MRKFFMGALVALMMSFGLVAAGAGAASAAPKCPYTGCVKTSVSASMPGQITKGGTLVINVNVNVKAGSGSPRGTITATCSRPGKTKVKTVAYTGPRSVRFKLNKAVKWNCTVTFVSSRKFRKSSTAGTVQVVRGRR